MVFDPLVLDPRTDAVWHDFVAERPVPAGREDIVRHWSRARDLGALPRGPRPEDALVRGVDLDARIERVEPLLASCAEMLDRIAATSAAHDFSLLLSDADGVIVHAAGGGEFAEHARRVRLMEGADWSEATRGTNAIGTALAERRPVFVRGAAHYARDYHELVCYAAPIRDHAGEIVAVLDATSSTARADTSVGFGVIATAHAMQELLRVRAYSRAGATVTRALARSLERMNCPVAIVEPPGRIRRINAPARELLPGIGGDTDVRDLLGLDFQQLAALGREGAPMHVSARDGRRLRVRLDPLESDGRLLAVVAFFEPARRPVPRPPKPAPPSTAPFGDMFAEDDAVRRSLQWAARIAASDIPVMLLAETGSGKELVARGIHRASRRADGPFVAVNCGSIAASLLESELFGYGPGAFTGAEKTGREGYLRAACGGTLFLDEVAEMPLAMQAALLRVLESGTYQRVGETQPRHADVRVVCATCRDLPKMVQDGSFRQDLYYRLKGATVTLPPLRERSDVVALARHLVADLAGRRQVGDAPTISAEVEAFLSRYPWPGNVRELVSTLDVALVLAAGDETLRLEHLPPDLHAAARDDGPSGALADAESQALRQAMREAGGNISRAARLLGVARSTLYRMLRRHDIG